MRFEVYAYGIIQAQFSDLKSQTSILKPQTSILKPQISNLKSQINMEIENDIYVLSKAFALRIIHLYRYLTNEKRENVISKQLLRSGTSIGANVHEAKNAQSRADFSSKMNIALKEATESEYWIDLLKEAELRQYSLKLSKQRKFQKNKPQFSNLKPQTSNLMDDFQSILENGISFKGSSGPKKEDDKVKTKAKKKKYVTGAHGSGSAKQKAKYRQQRANRHK